MTTMHQNVEKMARALERIANALEHANTPRLTFTDEQPTEVRLPNLTSSFAGSWEFVDATEGLADTTVTGYVEGHWPDNAPDGEDPDGDNAAHRSTE